MRANIAYLSKYLYIFKKNIKVQHHNSWGELDRHNQCIIFSLTINLIVWTLTAKIIFVNGQNLMNAIVQGQIYDVVRVHIFTHTNLYKFKWLSDR